MTAIEITKEKIKKIVSNKGDVRLLVVIYALWIAIMTWVVWTPLPSAPVAPDVFGYDDVAACRDTVLDHAKCIADENSKAATLAITYRITVVLFVPLALMLLIIISTLTVEWIREGYRKSG